MGKTEGEGLPSIKAKLITSYSTREAPHHAAAAAASTASSDLTLACE